ncbi:7-methylguanosine nucleotidase [Marchantia polymorpha subsp. ruderalis]|uniref:5'-nucleotidase n=2 Tax=Marchantia polymorpha TaxID=3197 RepID=A0A176VJ45_MARPO|nr:hypothetical protein AXG93_3932s1060 [Marchantia polymorpha subsp. ruderalis]PTQ34248.1 hypothetical protein MARPO_0082s0075 [Marchantia polymorpha]BBN02499.1 hypothetical protein Mp_2g15800 [Marchantia polymorpha subsp. ruderalis]|eukprot:PTQ34248.1 hypothetical protein MARPO_0082s0075 [Marchantia polymorpha]
MRGLAAGWAQPWRRLTRGVWQWEKGVHRARRLSGVSTFRLHRAALAPYIMSNSSLSLPSSAAPPLRLSGPSFRALQHKPFGPPIHSRFGWYRARSITSSKMDQQTLNVKSPNIANPSRISNIVVGNLDELAKKKAAIRAAGMSSLQVIADFDMTLTKYMVEGRRGQSTHALLSQGSTDYDRKRQELFDIYYPMEISPNIPVEEKTKLMETWWGKSHGLLVEGGLNIENIRQSVEKGTVGFREGIADLFEILDGEGVPLLIFSAGLADIIEEILRQKLHRTFPNIRVVSNRMNFDKDGNLTGFIGKTIHVLNKNEHALEMAAPLHDEEGHSVGSNGNGSSFIKGRKNVILLGDHLGDLGMSDGVAYDNRISVGFLNENVENWLDTYRRAFDIVVLNDGTLDCVVELIQELRS